MRMVLYLFVSLFFVLAVVTWVVEGAFSLYRRKRGGRKLAPAANVDVKDVRKRQQETMGTKQEGKRQQLTDGEKRRYVTQKNSTTATSPSASRIERKEVRELLAATSYTGEDGSTSSSSSNDGWQLWEDRLIREEQDQEYEASLREDRRKERQRLEAARQKQLEQERKRREREERLQRLKELPEPSASEAEDVAIIRIRTAEGNNCSRRFHRNDPLMNVFRYVEGKDLDLGAEAYQLATSFPRKLLNKESHANQSLDELGLFPQATLHVEHN
ncbi:UAS domain-containing protein [Balamuthia mandrillaris]